MPDTGQTIRIEGLDEAQAALKRLGHEVKDGRPIFREFYKWWAISVSRSWEKIKAKGGRFRGEVDWPGMKPQYTRRGVSGPMRQFAAAGPVTGQQVPAWGGVPKVFGSGTVKGKKRPSGTRVKQDSIMMKDTGDMRNAILAGWRALTPSLLHIGFGNLKHGIAQNEMREALFWAKKDPLMLENFALDHVDKELKRFER